MLKYTLYKTRSTQRFVLVVQKLLSFDGINENSILVHRYMENIRNRTFQY